MFLEELDDVTEGASIAVPVKDKAGRSLLAVILRYEFHVDDNGVVSLAEDPEPPLLVDECHGEDPSKSSIKRPSQLFEEKPGTDVILVGHAHAPLGKSPEHVDVRLSMGPIDKTVRAYGLRAWQRKLGGALRPGPARPIREPVPLRYELAWGGCDFTDPTELISEPRNLVGRGIARDPKTLVDEPAAQLEYPDHPLGRGENLPACFGALHRHWEPRCRFAGTYDQAWMDRKMPLLPDDFDPRFHVAVPDDQWCATPLRGDEPVEIRGATPEGVWRFRLPRVSPGFSSFVGSQRSEHRTHLDSVLIDADARTVELTWRVSIPLPRKYEMLDAVTIFEKDLV